MTDVATAALITAVSSFAVATVAGGIALYNRKKTDANAVTISRVQATLDGDLEKLKASLSHGQLINSTQWDAEFNSYRALWKGMVLVRTLANKLVYREKEMIEIGVDENYLVSPNRIEILKDNLDDFVKASQGLLHSIHDNAPFYPNSIRSAASETHSEVKKFFDRNISALTSLMKGVDLRRDAAFVEWNEASFSRIVRGVDTTEMLIRERLATVQVMQPPR